MKKVFILILLLCSTFVLSSCGLLFPIPSGSNTTTNNQTTTANGNKTLVVDKTINVNSSSINHVNFVEINDTHGQLVSGQDSEMGMSEVGGLINYLEESDGLPYIKVCNGDLLQGSYVSRLTYGKCMIESMNILGFHMMVIGNHEFDWVLDTIKIYWDGDPLNGEANFPLVCCNLIDSRINGRPDWVKPYVVFEYGDVKVGIIGAIGGALESTVADTTITTYSFDILDPYVTKYSKELREGGCDIVCLSVHDYGTSYKTYAKLKDESRIDAIFFGHTHESVDGYYTREADGYKIPYVQSYTKNMNIGTIKLNINENKEPVSGIIGHYNKSYFNHYVKTTIRELDDLIEENYQSIIDNGSKVLMEIDPNLYTTKEKTASFSLDILIEKYNCDLGFVNTGGVRTNLKGVSELTINDIFEVFPFDNKVCILEMKGNKVIDYFSRQTGICYNSEFDLSKVDKTKTYRIFGIDYVCNKNNKAISNYCVNNTFEALDDIMRDSLIEALESK